MQTKEIQIILSNPEAIVLFDWLARFNEKEDAEFSDPAEQRVLFDLEAQLETKLVEPLSSDYKELLEKARKIVRDNSN